MTPDHTANLERGLHAVGEDDLACVVTALEMLEPPAGLRRLAAEGGVPLQLVRWKAPDPAKYLQLYKRVGGPWIWWTRLTKSEVELAAILNDPGVQVFAVADRARIEVGMIELDFRVPGECEIVFFGMVPEVTGKGYGKWLMQLALQMAWAKDVKRVWLHTCTIDDPRAVPFYMARGFVPFARFVEIFPDPRLSGLYPDAAARAHPVLRG